ncbi:GxxExxY protein [Flavobacterium lacus]|uniref:GxxExxY protein n=1 Tax=Flavobacterium lacus TaxID=1353778 RepID=A0A328WVE3_9FLAO|nr:GxxExxY protein [Flavobacterium lacus]RAR49096.1 GxxExxY protein [Flavobacterium lacus]
MQHKETTAEIINSFYKVYNTLGFGFLEKVYENALSIELKTKGFNCKRQNPITVFYEDEIVGEYFADLIVNDEIIIELKACETLIKEHEIQVINYLKATKIEVALLLNFGKTPEIKRKIYSNEFKKINKNH